ncbi:MAG: hypothetical protein E7071_03635 [Bacteroidales bacterium]|nr:hypothetical protein [Bacteroidales bacterium]
MKKTLNKFLNEFKSNKSYLQYILAFLSFAFIMTSYEDNLKCLFDEMVMPILSEFRANMYSLVLVCILVFVVASDIKSKWSYRYRFDGRWIFVLFCILFVTLRYRFSGLYNFVPWLWCVSYVDICIVAGLAYLIVAIINIIRIHSNKQDSICSQVDGIIRDWPIEGKNEDIFDLAEEAKKIAGEILSLDKSKTWSLAITAPWGAGKTSFLNLIKENFYDNDFEIVYFNPRDSKSYQTIQEDFFNLITCVLSKYDSGCSSVMKDYMSSLQLIDNRGVIEKVVSFYRIWDKENLKDKLKKSFAHIGKKVLVLIDDFDRLSKEEILEVLKLIDSNAAFANLIFLTAYDKSQVNKALGESNNTDEACFVDKFFNLEFVIPSRSYSYITNYISDNLCSMLNAKAYEASSIKTTLNDVENFLKEYLPTLRDAKRFINQFYMDYRLVRGDVKLFEYVLVQLIKYRYHDEYTKLFRKQYIETSSVFSSRQLYYLKKDIDEECKIKSLLVKLFPKQNRSIEYSGETYRHIFDTQSFDNYFVNQIYGTMRIGEMESILHCTITEAYGKIDEWVKNENQLNDIIAYLFNFDMNSFNSGENYLRFADVIAYLAVKRPESRAYWLFIRLIYLYNLKGYDKKYNLNMEKYKDRLLGIIVDEKKDSNFQLVRYIHSAFCTHKIKEEEQLIKDADIWPSIKRQFLKVCPEFDDLQVMKGWLYNCIDHMEPSSRHIILDRECLDACRERIIARPDIYIKDFVFLGCISSNPELNTIACEPFWEQIFGDATKFENFISDCETNGVENINLVRNFWELYKANKYNQIEFDNQGNVQEKIDYGLNKEANLLKHAQDIWFGINSLTHITDESSQEEIKKRIGVVQEAIIKLDEINLNIAWLFDIKKELATTLSSLNCRLR